MPAATDIYRVLDPLYHNGQWVKEDGLVELTQQQAMSLLAIGTISGPVDVEPEAPAKKPAPRAKPKAKAEPKAS